MTCSAQPAIVLSRSTYAGIDRAFPHSVAEGPALTSGSFLLPADDYLHQSIIAGGVLIICTGIHVSGLAARKRRSV
jgi:hypothetical protein